MSKRRARRELVVALIELGQALGGHVAAGFVPTDGLQHVLALLAAPLLFGGELRESPLERGALEVRWLTTAVTRRCLIHTICPVVMRQSPQHRT